MLSFKPISNGGYKSKYPRGSKKNKELMGKVSMRKSSSYDSWDSDFRNNRHVYLFMSKLEGKDYFEAKDKFMKLCSEANFEAAWEPFGDQWLKWFDDTFWRGCEYYVDENNIIRKYNRETNKQRWGKTHRIWTKEELLYNRKNIINPGKVRKIPKEYAILPSQRLKRIIYLGNLWVALDLTSESIKMPVYHVESFNELYQKIQIAGYKSLDYFGEYKIDEFDFDEEGNGKMFQKTKMGNLGIGPLNTVVFKNQIDKYKKCK